MKKLESLLNVNVQLFARRPGDASDSVREGGQESVAGGCRSRTTSRRHVGRERLELSETTCLNGFFKGKSPYLFRPFLHLIGLAFLLAFFVGGRATTKSLKEIVAAALVRP